MLSRAHFIFTLPAGARVGSLTKVMLLHVSGSEFVFEVVYQIDHGFWTELAQAERLF